MAKKRYADKKWLKRKYKDQHKNVEQMAKLADCTPGTINKWLHIQGIRKLPKKREKELLKYSKEEKTIEDFPNAEIKVRIISWVKMPCFQVQEMKGRKIEDLIATYMELKDRSITVKQTSPKYIPSEIVPNEILSEKGTPDLLVYKNKEPIKFVEVKVSGGLNIEQVDWIIRHSDEYPVEVVWLDKRPIECQEGMLERMEE